MSGRSKQQGWSGSALLIGCLSAFAAFSANSFASELTGSIGGTTITEPRAHYAIVGEQTHPPIGWTMFCAEYKQECDTQPSTPHDIVLSAAAWRDLNKVNTWVNDNVKPITDMDHWGVVERWSYPDDGYGDCEDYALLKRRMLIEAGWPREALLMTVVRDRRNEGHAVLTVKTDRGEFILDNQTSKILAWTDTGYRLVKRQSQSDQNVWVSLGDQYTAPAVVSAR